MSAMGRSPDLQRRLTGGQRPRWNGHRPSSAVSHLRGVGGGNGVAECQLRNQPLQNGGPEMHATTYGLDVAKRVFQMYWVDADTGEIVNRRFGRDDLIQYLSRRAPGRVALEACGSAH